ncbi:MAG: hypothetical protein HYY06_05065 [Deltaproteobacteria bacterium]|nr:hypothetical protein [Deltaproteobacteria bacterium]
MRLAWRAFWLLAVAALQASTADAAVVLALDLADMTGAAQVVAEIEVTRTHSRRLASGQIVTDVEAVVLEGIKGAVDGEDLVLFTEGGIAGGIGANVPGEPRLRAGDRVVAFLEPAGEGLRFVGMSQGCFRVIESPTGAVVRPGGAGLVLVRRTPAGLRPAGPALAAPRALSTFLDEVRALAAAR